MSRWVYIAALAAAVGPLAATSAAGDDFRIHTRLYEGDADKPASENPTLFRAGVVYDFPAGEEQVTVFDAPRQRFVLLDRERRMRCEIRTSDIEQFVSQLHDWAASQENDAFVRFQADPSFEIEPGVAANQMTFKSPWMTYRIVTEPAPTETAAQLYGEFSDWYARLNTMTRRALLPFARLQVNEALRQKKVVPQEVRLEVENPGPLRGVRKDVQLRTVHQVVWKLSESDLKQIDRTGRDLVEFSVVEYERFRQEDKQAGR